MKNKNIISLLVMVVVVILLSTVATSAAPANPPSNNTETPLHVGLGEFSTQKKLGPLYINTSVTSPASIGFVVLNGRVGFGTSNPNTDSRLEVVGMPVRATGGLIIETRTSAPANLSSQPGRIWLQN